MRAAGSPAINGRLGTAVAGWWKGGALVGGRAHLALGITASSRPSDHTRHPSLPLRGLMLCLPFGLLESLLVPRVSAVYTATTPHPSSDQSAIFINFFRSASSCCPFFRHSRALVIAVAEIGAPGDVVASSVSASATVSLRLLLKMACSFLPFLR